MQEVEGYEQVWFSQLVWFPWFERVFGSECDNLSLFCRVNVIILKLRVILVL